MTDITQLIERLREAERRGAWNDFDADLFEEAAEVIQSQAAEIAELREVLKPFAEAHKQLEHMPSNAKWEHGLVSADRRLFSKDELAPARTKLEGSGA